MDIVAIVVRRLKDWVKSRPQLDVEESATWFLLLFIYAHGLTKDGLGIRWSGAIPEITAPQVSLEIWPETPGDRAVDYTLGELS